MRASNRVFFGVEGDSVSCLRGAFLVQFDRINRVFHREVASHVTFVECVRVARTLTRAWVDWFLYGGAEFEVCLLR